MLDKEPAGLDLLIGRTIDKISGAYQDSESVYFHCGDDAFRAYHMQDCCEQVSVYKVLGDLADLIDSPVISTKEYAQVENPEFIPADFKHHDESWTWTLHRIETARGTVEIWWLGFSNGYYSESVYFQRTH